MSRMVRWCAGATSNTTPATTPSRPARRWRRRFRSNVLIERQRTLPSPLVREGGADASPCRMRGSIRVLACGEIPSPAALCASTSPTRGEVHTVNAASLFALRQQPFLPCLLEPLPEHVLGVHHLGEAGAVDLHRGDDRGRAGFGVA